jgi:Phosphate-selective porin O and P
MRIAISALVGMTVTLASTFARAQAAPPPSEVPPAPPAPGATPVPEAPAAMPSPFPEGESSDDRVETAGWRDGFFLRDARDIVRFYPHLLVETDFYSSFGPGVSSVTAPDVALGLKPHLSIHRARVGFDAELFKRWTVSAILEMGGQPVGDTAGNAETSAAGPGTTPTATSGRYAPVQTIATAPAPGDVFIGYSVCKCFNIQIGQFNAPFSMDNRTPDDYYPLMERNVAIRGFAVPNEREIGGMLWGELGPRVFDYELGVFGGDGPNRPSVDANVDFIGRMYARPFAGGATNDVEKYTQIGVSGRHGTRDPAAVGYDYPSITTGQGFVLWKPTYTDSLGRLIHVIPSAAQNEIGGELRMQAGRFALQGEAYYVANDTREAVDGYQLTNTERFGRMLGVGWYAQVSAWPFGDAFLTPEPGVFQPRHLDLSGKPPSRTPHGLEVTAQISGINGSYEGASRLMSTPDVSTPAGGITVYQVGLAATYWHTKHARFTVNYNAYITPGTPGNAAGSNEAIVPDNMTTGTDGKPNQGHVLHELGARLAIAF